jgi:putative tricarboxylic transport membrane protein
MKKHNLIGASLWMIFAAGLMIESLRLGIGTFRNPDAGLFPLLTACLMFVFGVILLFDEIVKTRGKKEAQKEIWPRGTNVRNIIFALVGLIGYAVILQPLGYLLATFLCMVFFFKFIYPQKWNVSLLGAVVTVLLSYLVFHIWLQCELPDGKILKWVGWNL